MRSRILLFRFFFAVLILTLAGCGKPVLYGKVTDPAGQPVSGAFVSVENTGFVAMTAEDGGYELDYPAGELKLIVSKSGYNTMEMSLSIPRKRRYPVPEVQLQPRTRGDDSPRTAEQPAEENPEGEEINLTAEVREAAVHIQRQQKTVREIEMIGRALYSWISDEMSAGVPGQQMVDVQSQYYPYISQSQLRRVLVPKYLEELPERDAWGHPYEFRVNLKNPDARFVFVIRSPGRDGRFSTSVYSRGGFPPGDLDEDIVWADGGFVRWPDVTEM